MSFIADDLGAWLVGILADAGKNKLIEWVLGTPQERALREAATSAVTDAAQELRPESSGSAEELALVINQVFSEPMPNASAWRQGTLLEALQSSIAAQLATLNDAQLTDTGQSSAEVLGLSYAMLTKTLTGNLIGEIVMRGSRGGPLYPLAAQLNHDVTHLQGQRLEAMVGELARDVRFALSKRADWNDVIDQALDDLTVALRGLSEQELLRIGNEANVIPTGTDQGDVEQMIAAALSHQRLFRLIEACTAATSAGRALNNDSPEVVSAELIYPTVVFHSTGERMSVTLPIDLDVRRAAEKIIGEIFLKELPPLRRTAYLFNAECHLVHNGNVLREGTLRDAGIADSSELTIISYAPYPWAHDADFAASLHQDHLKAMKGIRYRLLNYTRSTLCLRMAWRGLELYGPPGGSGIAEDAPIVE